MSIEVTPAPNDRSSNIGWIPVARTYEDQQVAEGDQIEEVGEGSIGQPARGPLEGEEPTGASNGTRGLGDQAGREVVVEISDPEPRFTQTAGPGWRVA